MTNKIKASLSVDGGSFRDPMGQVFALENKIGEKKIFRGLNAQALDQFRHLDQQSFFQSFQTDGYVVRTREVLSEDITSHTFDKIKSKGWAGVLEHQTIPFISYPYEWGFSMLKSAALLHLRLMEGCLENGWILKDATPYNIQWLNNHPIFIDTPSFVPWKEGEPWVAYNQFCRMFLFPLLLHAHLKIDHGPLLRSYLDGIPATEAAKYFSGFKRLKSGVLPHVVFPAKVETALLKKHRDGAALQKPASRKHSKAMVLGLVQSLSRLVTKLERPIGHTNWSKYDETHSYQEKELAEKKAFVEQHVRTLKLDLVWDLGANTGTFSKVASSHAKQVLALDADHDSIEILHSFESKKTSSNILPLVIDVVNQSPAQGWAGVERTRLEQRGKPNLIIALALLHHTRISANIPNRNFLAWVASLGADLCVEFVNRTDEMVQKLLAQKVEQYEDYNLNSFRQDCLAHFQIVDEQPLKGGKRHIFYLKPRVGVDKNSGQNL